MRSKQAKIRWYEIRTGIQTKLSVDERINLCEALDYHVEGGELYSDPIVDEYYKCMGY